MSKKSKNLDKEALAFHSTGRPGKLEISATKPLTSQHDLSLAYSPGVAAPCLKTQANPETAYDYTAKGNLVAVISNGDLCSGYRKKYRCKLWLFYYANLKCIPGIYLLW